MKIICRLTPLEFGSANVMLLLNCREAKTVKIAQGHWSRLASFLHKQIPLMHKQTALSAQHKLTRVSKSYISTGETAYITEWDDAGAAISNANAI